MVLPWTLLRDWLPADVFSLASEPMLTLDQYGLVPPSDIKTWPDLPTVLGNTGVQNTEVALVVRNWPLLLVWEGRMALAAPFWVVAPVPPLSRGTVPKVIAGVVVPVVTLMGAVPVTLVTVPLPLPLKVLQSEPVR